jgi:hypothetical protein
LCTQICWGSGICASSRIKETRKKGFGKTVSFLRRRKEDTYLLGPLETANEQVQCLGSSLSKGPNRLVVFLFSREDGNRSSFRNVAFSMF